MGVAGECRVELGGEPGKAVGLTVGASEFEAGNVDTESMIAAFKGLKLDTPFGPIEYRAIDHQSTMGEYVGKIAVKDGQGVMVDAVYQAGEKYLPTDDAVKTLRAAD